MLISSKMAFKQLTKEESKLKIRELVNEYATKIKDRERSLDLKLGY